MVWELIGHAGGFLIAIALMPQLIKTWKTQSAQDISLLWTIVSLIGLFLYAVYAFKNNVVPLMVFATLEFSMVIVLIVFKLLFSNPKTI